MPKKTKAKKLLLQTPKGMHDILPPNDRWYEKIFKTFKEIAEFYGFKKIITPILEYAMLFERGVGRYTDMISKEMYVFKTKGGDILALRPEGTSPVLRAYFEHNFDKFHSIQKFYYFGPFFRHENPQVGRYREFNQVGAEIIGGKNDPLYDAEVISLGCHFLKELKIQNTILNINSIGCPRCRPKYIKKLDDYYKKHITLICKDCNRRLKTNSLRVLDCKNEKCQLIKSKAPNILDSLCLNCRDHLKNVLEYLDELNIAYNLNFTLVRGLDYYSKTVFEYMIEGSGSDVGSVGGGGRYDYLAEMLDRDFTPALGLAFGVERLIYVMQANQIKLPERIGKKVFIIHLGDLAKKRTLFLINKLKDSGVSFVETQYKESLKAQMKSANKAGADLVLIIGQKEVFDNTVIIKDMASGLQETVPISKLTEVVKKYIKNI